jgi:hypothetical protein
MILRYISYSATRCWKIGRPDSSNWAGDRAVSAHIMGNRWHGYYSMCFFDYCGASACCIRGQGISRNWNKNI